jgi:hypothetical protein
MVEVLGAMSPRVVIPMHFFGPATLDRFLIRASERFEVTKSDSPSLVLSRETLPARPRVVALPGH